MGGEGAKKTSKTQQLSWDSYVKHDIWKTNMKMSLRLTDTQVTERMPKPQLRSHPFWGDVGHCALCNDGHVRNSATHTVCTGEQKRKTD